MESISIYDISLAVIAVLALFVSFRQFHIQRKHNKLSVRPLLVLRHKWESKLRYRKVFLVNVGLGPAIITNFIFSNEGEVIPLSTTADIDLLYIDHTFSVPPNVKKIDKEKSGWSLGVYTKGEGLSVGDVLQPDEKINIITLELNSEQFSLSEDGKKVDPKEYCITLFDIAVNYLNKSTFHIEYKSLYNEKQKPLVEKSLSAPIDAII